MRKTAVEWLDEQIEYISIQVIDGFLTIKEFMEEREKLFKQAKEMEKQQKIDAANLQRSDYRGMPTYNKSGEQYYNETFKTK